MIGKEKMMKKQVLFIILNFSVVYTSFGQYFDYISLGYNTVETTNERGEEISIVYYFSNDQFSKMTIERAYNVLLLETKTTNEWGEVISVDTLLGGGIEFHSTYRDEGYYNFDGFNEIYRTVDGKLIFVELDYRGDKYLSEKIEYTSSGLTVYMDDGIVKKFYNMPEAELYDKFMRALVREIKWVCSDEFLRRSGTRGVIDEQLKKLTKDELAIFRNCLFAKHAYAFQHPAWQEFMEKYYNEFGGYRSIYSNAEVLNQLSANENWLLESILEYEK
jgi:hypothetical protein